MCTEPGEIRGNTPEITKQPEAVKGFPGDSVSFTVETWGEGLTYQWQISANGGKNWSSSNGLGSNTPTLYGFTITNARDGNLYRCKITDADGNVLCSEIAEIILAKDEWAFTYNADGMRTQRTGCGSTYTYVYNEGQLSQMTVDGEVLRFSYDATGLPMALTYNGRYYYYVTNLQGDVIAILNTAGTAVVEYTYDAWGNPISTTGTMAATLGKLNPLRYRGYVYDEETGFYYVSSRYYDPEIGRWISPEPNVDYGEFDEGAGLIGYNVYAYCANNPVMFKDETGESIILAMAIGAGVGALISGIVKIYQNRKGGQKWYKGLAISMLAGGVGGAISCISIPGVSSWVCAAVFGAAGSVTTKVILGEIKSIGDLTSAIAVGAGAGLLGNAASKLLIKGVSKYFGSLTKAKQKAFLGRIGRITNAQLKAIRKQIAKGLTPAALDKLVKKYGYDVLVSAFVSSTATSAK